MHRFDERLRLARMLGQTVRLLARADELAYALEFNQLGDQLMECELKVFELHRQVLNGPARSARPPELGDIPF